MAAKRGGSRLFAAMKGMHLLFRSNGGVFQFRPSTKPLPPAIAIAGTRTHIAYGLPLFCRDDRVSRQEDLADYRRDTETEDALLGKQPPLAINERFGIYALRATCGVLGAQKLTYQS